MPRHSLRDARGRFRRREYCGLGPCAALEGHELSCEEASGWVTLDYAQATPWYRRLGDQIQYITEVPPTLLTTTTGGGMALIAGNYTTGNTIHTIQAETWDRWYATGTGNTITARTLQTNTWRQWYDMGTMTTYYEDDYGNRQEIQDEVWARWGVRDQAIPQVQDFAREEVRRRQQAEQDERQRLREEASRRRLAAAPLIKKAPDRAQELLEMILTADEKQYRAENNGRVLVRGGETGNLYIVDTKYNGVHGNIRQVDEHGCNLAVLCVAPEMFHRDEHGDGYGMPLADGYVGQILSIKGNEKQLIAKANFSRRRPCEREGAISLRSVPRAA